MQVRSRRISTLSSKGNEAHGGYGFCALAAIIILDIQWQEWQEQGLSQGETLTRSLEDNNYPVVFPGAATPSERPLDKVDLEAFAGWIEEALKDVKCIVKNEWHVEICTM